MVEKMDEIKIKRGEIREVISAYTDDQCLYLDGVCKFRSNDFKGVYCSSNDGAYNCLVKRLGEIGVVIKVEKELPKRFLCAGRTSRESYKLGTEDMLVASYVAVESLIELCPKCGKEPHLCKCPTINRGSFAKYVKPLVEK